jgi:hypothetical protein
MEADIPPPDAGILLVSTPMTRKRLAGIAEGSFGEMTKAVVDVAQEIMAVGGELHSDEEAFLLERGSRQADLWGINLYPNTNLPDMVEFDSMINVRPGQGNRSRSVESQELRQRITDIVRKLIV